ncbi:MAG: hypothetical protein HC904_08980 [Blastochloris sp.]|nr:hypothetical protein [Blastochloris sp.]
MEPIAQQVDEIYRRRVLRARATDPLERMWDGPRLFEMACRVVRRGAEDQVGPERAEAEFQRRLKLAALLSERHRP